MYIPDSHPSMVCNILDGHWTSSQFNSLLFISHRKRVLADFWQHNNPLHQHFCTLASFPSRKVVEVRLIIKFCNRFDSSTAVFTSPINGTPIILNFTDSEQGPGG